MKNRYFCRSPYLNVYETATTKSNLSSQILYGEKFQIIQKKRNFLNSKKNDETVYLKNIENMIKNKRTKAEDSLKDL